MGIMSVCCKFTSESTSEKKFENRGNRYNGYNVSLLQIYQWVYEWKKIWKSVNIWGSYGQEFSVLFFDSLSLMV